jgi:hypothetical protein
MDYKILLHNAIIELLLLVLIVYLYYNIPKEDYMPVCLLGSYIVAKSLFNFAHYMYHIRQQKKAEQPVDKTTA